MNLSGDDDLCDIQEDDNTGVDFIENLINSIEPFDYNSPSIQHTVLPNIEQHLLITLIYYNSQAN